MHEGHIAGPGLALYYNSLRFFIFAFALAAVFTYVALESSGFADAKLAAEAPCRLDSEEEIAAATQALFQYRWTSFTALAGLWVVLFFMSLAHVSLQQAATSSDPFVNIGRRKSSKGIEGLTPDRSTSCFFEVILAL